MNSLPLATGATRRTPSASAAEPSLHQAAPLPEGWARQAASNLPQLLRFIGSSIGTNLRRGEPAQANAPSEALWKELATRGIGHMRGRDREEGLVSPEMFTRYFDDPGNAVAREIRERWLGGERFDSLVLDRRDEIADELLVNLGLRQLDADDIRHLSQEFAPLLDRSSQTLDRTMSARQKSLDYVDPLKRTPDPVLDAILRAGPDSALHQPIYQPNVTTARELETRLEEARNVLPPADHQALLRRLNHPFDPKHLGTVTQEPAAPAPAPDVQPPPTDNPPDPFWLCADGSQGQGPSASLACQGRGGADNPSER